MIPMNDTNSRQLWPRPVLLGVPALYAVLGLLHPLENPTVGDPTDLWMALHLAQLPLIAGMAFVFWLLVDGIRSRAATVARALIIPYVVWYTTLDSILGLAWGLVARQGTQMATADQPAAGRLMDDLLKETPAGYALYFGAGLLFLGLVLATVTALGPTAPRVSIGLIAAGGLLVALGHAPPTGPLGMLGLLVGIAFLERSRSTTSRPEGPTTPEVAQSQGPPIEAGGARP